jgi:hypothetical protein
MKKSLLLIAFILLTGRFLFSQTATPPAAGDGTVGSPYQIATLANLFWIAASDAIVPNPARATRMTYNYVQTADIDASSTGQGGDWGITGWVPIGNITDVFTGTYEGQRHQITNLYINRTNNRVGLFGVTESATITNLGVSNVTITGGSYSGGLIGECLTSTVQKCFATGILTGKQTYAGSLGGLIGYNDASSVKFCYASVAIWAGVSADKIGGLTGENYGKYLIENCYATGRVSGNGYVGGFAGTTSDGFLVGGKVNNCFATGLVTGNTNVGGFIGYHNSLSPTNCFWDITTSGQASSDGGTGLSTAEMKLVSTYSVVGPGLSKAWDFIGNLNNDTGNNSDWNLDGTTNNGYPFLSWQTFAWTGTTNSDWSTLSNWLTGSLPGVNDAVSISLATTNPAIGAPADCQSLNIASGNSLTIQPNGNLTVNGSISNNAGNSGLVIQSDATGTGSLLHANNGVAATVQRYIAAADWGIWNDGWHFLSSPVADQATGTFHTPGAGNDFYKWDEANNIWINRSLLNGEDLVLNPEFELSFSVGRGYLVAYQTTATKTFSGVLNTGDQVTSLLTSVVNGWNLVGNPFPCAIRWNDGSWNLGNVGGVAQIWSETAKDYVEIFSNDPIPAMNGFMVYTTSAQTLNIPANARTHAITSWYKSEMAGSRIVLVAHDPEGGSYKRSVIRQHPDATEGFDLAYDAYMLSGFAPKFYSVSESARLTVNTMPQIDELTEIHFGFIKNNSTNYYLELAETIEGQTTYLTDLKTGQVHNFNNGNYYFTSDEGDDTLRFKLHFGAAGMPEAPDVNPMDVYIHQQTIFVRHPEPGLILTVYDLQGRQLSTQMLKKDENSIQINLPAGMYIVKAHNATVSYSTKIIVSR